MIMQMIHRLPRALAVVRHEAEAAIEPAALGQVSGQALQVPEKRLILVNRRRKARNMLLRYDQKMRGSLRIDILKGYRQLVFVDLLGWDTAIDDTAKKAAHSYAIIRNLAPPHKGLRGMSA